MEINRMTRGARLVTLGTWLGLLYGFIEGGAFWVLSFIPGALSWRTGNDYHALWFAPLFYTVSFTILGALVALLSRLRESLPWERILVFLCAGTGTFLLLSLPGVLWRTACAALALGIGVQAAAIHARHADRVAAIRTRTLPLLAAAVVLVAIGSAGFSRARETLAMKRLPAIPPGAQRPNILLLVIDTERADHLSSYGYARETSPRIDALAREGVLFEQAYSHSSWTLPSHATMFTGQPMHEHRAGLVRRPYLDGRFPTLAEVLRDAGYVTGGFVANTYWCGRQTGLARGFVRYEDFYGSLGDATARTVLGRTIKYQVLPWLGSDEIPGRKDARTITDDVLAWVDGIEGRPFFAFANYFDVHAPYRPPPQTAGKFGWAPERERSTGIDIGALDEIKTLPPPEELERQKAGYDESMLYVDQEIGRLTEELRRRGALDNTVVIITSDHGESWGEHGLLRHGHSLYGDQVRVPLIVRYPRAFPSGARVPHPVGNQQLPATIAELAGLGAHPFPGRSLVRAADPGDPGRDTVLLEVGRRSIARRIWPVARGWVAGLVADRWHFLVEQSGRTDLYDIRADPAEQRNLAASASASGTIGALQAHLARMPRERAFGPVARCDSAPCAAPPAPVRAAAPPASPSARAEAGRSTPVRPASSATPASSPGSPRR
jgi:arylsulfatase A-like enzyme